jgi:hypothetical protein
MLTLNAHISHGARHRTLLSLAALALAALLLGVSAHPGPLDEEELEGRAPTAEELRPSVEAAFTYESYTPRSTATLVFFNTVRRVRLQLFRVGPETIRTRGSSEMHGVPVSSKFSTGNVRAGKAVHVELGSWPSGLYFARLTAADGRIGFAPFVLRPRRLGAHRVAVVLPTLTWQAYNLRDDNGDGKGDSWYADWKHLTVRLGRPFLNRGVPYNFRIYDLPFLHWLARNGHQVDLLSDRDLDTVASGDGLARAYDLIVFPGHHEYVTTHEYDVVERYRDLGGNLAFLSANNFFWRVLKHGDTIDKTDQWRDLGRPEAALIGVQYRGNDGGTHRGPWIIRRSPRTSWLLAGTGFHAGSHLSSAGIEIDETAKASPRGVHVVAEIPDLFGPGFTAQMTYYETPQGAKVFAAGAFTLAGAALQPPVSRVLENLWRRLADDRPGAH